MAIPEPDPDFLAWWNTNWAKLSGRSAQSKSIMIWQASRQVGKTQALKDVEAERKRQVEVLGRTNEADDKYQLSELPRAAACYTIPYAKRMDDVWPWDPAYFPVAPMSPEVQRRNLVKAAALLLAEIERLDRAAAG
jgi:hypothetical protein